jgi:hypothetical protein
MGMCARARALDIEKPPAGNTGGVSTKLVSELPHTVVHVHQSSFAS